MPLSLYPHNYNSDSLGVILVIAPVVFLLGWLYNAHKLGKFKKSSQIAPRASIAKKSKRQKNLYLLCGITIGILLGLALRFLF